MHGWLKSHSEEKIILARSLLFKGHPYKKQKQNNDFQVKGQGL